MSHPARRWLELSVRSPSAGERAPLLAEALVAVGGRAAQERGGWFVTYVEEPDDVATFLADAAKTLAELTDLDDVEVATAWQLHEEWAESWKRGLAPRLVSERIVVRPSWIDPSEGPTAEVVIVLDPGMAFGTAEHGTTRGCLRLLDRVVTGGERVLDVGAGSGILSVAAALLGASEVRAVEGDSLSCEALRENVERNGVAGRVTVDEAWADRASLAALGAWDGVVANIETGILLPLFDPLFQSVRPGGWLIVSGILAEEIDGVRSALEALGAAVSTVDADGDWRSALVTRPA